MPTPATDRSDVSAEPVPEQTAAGSERSTRDVRRVVFVVGSGRSGTSTMSGTLQTLGLHVPQPEVQADATNPKGFGEPKWVVELHDELLRRSQVQVSDARPQAWFEAGKLSTVEPLRERLHTWLERQFVEGGDELVIKDPRLAWFLGLWRAAAVRCGATPSYVTMLRPVTEVVGSKQRYYSQRFGEVNRIAGWINMMLHTERATRGSQRAFVRYHDLLTDWTVPLFGLGERFDLRAIRTASANDIRLVHQFIDPTLRRVDLTWDDVDCPARLRELADETWRRLDLLADDGADTPALHAELDELRTAYAELYEEAEAISQSTAVAARRQGFSQGERSAAESSAPPAAVSRADRIPHSLRAMVPARARRGLRKALGRER